MYLLHLWGGLLSSLVVFILCITGCLYAFKTQIADLYNRDKVFVTVSGSPISLEELESSMQSKGYHFTTVYLPKEKNRAWSLSYREESGVVKASNYDPYKRAFLGNSDQGLEKFFAVVLDMHRTLLLGDVGRQILGVGSLLFLSLMVTGFFIWLPKKLKYLKQSLTVKWKGKFQRVNYDFHKVIGFYSMIFLAFITITGLYVTYPWVKNALLMSLGAESITAVGTSESNAASDAFDSLMSDMLKRQDEKQDLATEKSASLADIVTSVKSLGDFPSAISIEFPGKENPRFMVKRTHSEHPLSFTVDDELSFDRTGQLQHQTLFKDLSVDKQFAALAKPLHTGEIMGLGSIIFYFFISLIGAMLPISGILIWWNRARKLK